MTWRRFGRDSFTMFTMQLVCVICWVRTQGCKMCHWWHLIWLMLCNNNLPTLQQRWPLLANYMVLRNRPFVGFVGLLQKLRVFEWVQSFHSTWVGEKGTWVYHQSLGQWISPCWTTQRICTNMLRGFWILWMHDSKLMDSGPVLFLVGLSPPTVS